jgi:hypothetical protein
MRGIVDHAPESADAIPMLADYVGTAADNQLGYVMPLWRVEERSRQQIEKRMPFLSERHKKMRIKVIYMEPDDARPAATELPFGCV